MKLKASQNNTDAAGNTGKVQMAQCEQAQMTTTATSKKQMNTEIKQAQHKSAHNNDTSNNNSNDSNKSKNQQQQQQQPQNQQQKNHNKNHNKRRNSVNNNGNGNNNKSNGTQKNQSTKSSGTNKNKNNNNKIVNTNSKQTTNQQQYTEGPQTKSTTVVTTINTNTNSVNTLKTQQQKTATPQTQRNNTHSYAQTLGSHKLQQQQQKSLNYGNNESKQNKTNAQYNDDNPLPGEKSSKQNKINRRNSKSPSPPNATANTITTTNENENEIVAKKLNPAELLTAALIKPCAKCSKPTATTDVALLSTATTSYIALEPWTFKGSKNNSNGNSSSRQYRKSKSYVASSRHLSNGDLINNSAGHKSNSRHHYQRSQSDRRSSFDRHFAERNKNFVPIEAPARPILSSSYIYAVIADTEKLVILQRLGKARITYPIMQVSCILFVFIKKKHLNYYKKKE